ncbi:unnamed protein product, partial [Tuber aestivum]
MYLYLSGVASMAKRTSENLELFIHSHPPPPTSQAYYYPFQFLPQQKKKPTRTRDLGHAIRNRGDQSPTPLQPLRQREDQHKSTYSLVAFKGRDIAPNRTSAILCPPTHHDGEQDTVADFSDLKPYKCAPCGVGCKRQTDLDRHFRTSRAHSMPKGPACPYGGSNVGQGQKKNSRKWQREPCQVLRPGNPNPRYICV